MLEYPKEFSSYSIARVEKARLEASIRYDENPTSGFDRINVHVSGVSPLIGYIAIVATMFGYEACELGKPSLTEPAGGDHWTTIRIQFETEAFAEKFAQFAHIEKLYRTPEDRRVSSEFMGMIYRTQEWRDFLRAHVAGLQSFPNVSPDPIPLLAASESSQTNAVIALHEQLNALFTEYRISVKEAAEFLKIEQKSVYRHMSGEAYPRMAHVTAYERLLTDRSGTPIRLNFNPPTKRHKKSKKVNRKRHKK